MLSKIFEFVKGLMPEGDVKTLVGMVPATSVDSDMAIMGLTEVFESVEDKLEDGITFREVVTILGQAVTEFVHLAEAYGSAGSGAEKKAFVIGASKALYRFVDGGVDGDKNRIDIPWVPSVLERSLEDKAVPLVAGLAVEAVVAVFNREK